MARRGYNRRSHARGYSSSSYGRDRAEQHVREAEQLSAELGGTDHDVKLYFFNLHSTELAQVLEEYGSRYGEEARNYAAQTIPAWRTGQRRMSGLVASRLFSLLPPRMPLREKYKLTENLWHHTGPTSHRVLRIGPDADLDDVLDKVRSHIADVVVHYTIPDNMSRRFEWLSAGDVNIKQQLLNHLRDMEKSLVLEGARAQLPVMLDHMRSEGQYTHHMAQVLTIGKHKLELVVDKASKRVTLEEPAIAARVSAVASASGKGSSGWVWLIATGVGGALLLLLAQ